MAQPSCSVIIVAYNSGSLLPVCLNSIQQALAKVHGEIIVIDNGSPYPLPESLKESYPDVHWMHSHENLGFGKACNRAAAQANSPYLFFVNPDTLVSTETFANLLGFIESHPNAGVVGCKILNGDGTLQWACRRSFPSPMAAIYKTLGLAALFPQSRKFANYNLTFLDPNQEAIVDAVSGSFFCVRKVVYDQVKGFDEDFFLYGEDLDICYRIQQTGLQNYYTPISTIVHFKGQSSKTRRVKSYVDFYQAMLIFARKHTQLLKPIPYWLVYMGIVFAAVLGIFPRLIPSWARMGFDLILMMILSFFLSMDTGYSFSWLAVSISGSVVLPALLLGEYGTQPVAPSRHFLWSAPLLLTVGICAGWKVFLWSLAGFLMIWGWRRIYFWFRYFQGVFSGRRLRSILLGGHPEISAWFLRENILPGRDILGCLSIEPDPLAREHCLGTIEDLEDLRKRTGIRELLVSPDSMGRFDRIPEKMQNDPTWTKKLLIGHPDSSTFALVDLDFLDKL